jgi:hypothetical protein
VIAGEPNRLSSTKFIDGIGDLCEDADAIEARECEPVGRSNALGGSVYDRCRRYDTDIEVVRLDGIRPTPSADQFRVVPPTIALHTSVRAVNAVGLIGP